MSFDDLFYKSYDKANYNCAHFLADAWQELKQENISEHLKFFLAEEKQAAAILRKRFHAHSEPVDPCIVLLHSRVAGHLAHVGMFTQGRVLHINAMGVHYQTLDVVKLGFHRCKFYTPCSNT